MFHAAMPDLSIPFRQRKAKILAELSRPDAEYSDLSPKGSVDEEIRGLIEEINARDGLVTTSSCAGRVSVFLEGSKVAGPLRDGPTETGSGDGEGARVSKAAGAGGKGGGGRWLFVSHEQLCEGEGEWKSMFGLEGAGLQHEGPEDDVSGHRGETRLIHFKFEPMVRPSKPLHFRMRLIRLSMRRSCISSPHRWTTRSTFYRPLCPQGSGRVVR
jgi:tRNA wybutosine-synthesizing protein 3